MITFTLPEARLISLDDFQRYVAQSRADLNEALDKFSACVEKGELGMAGFHLGSATAISHEQPALFAIGASVLTHEQERRRQPS